MLQEIANELDDLKAEGQKLGLQDSPDSPESRDIEEQDLDDLEEIDERLEDPNFDVNLNFRQLDVFIKTILRKPNQLLKLYPMKMLMSCHQNR